jgi:hypothetical protein
MSHHARPTYKHTIAARVIRQLPARHIASAFGSLMSTPKNGTIFSATSLAKKSCGPLLSLLKARLHE